MKIIKIKEFKKRIESNQKLVILDDYVLDVSEFLYDHPGGLFSIK